ncbi:MAG: ribokinase [Eubacteriales bacterium]|nr:ribokinase [Eubacteriales bacterium]
MPESTKVNENKAKIVVVGSFIADITSFVPRFPREGETVIGSMLKTGPGGKGSNSATAINRAGGSAVMITKTGRDTLSEICLNHYKEEGMDSRYVYTSDTVATGAAIIEVNENTGENRIIVMMGANLDLLPEEVRAAESEFESCRAVLVQMETNLDAVKEAITLAKKHNKLVVCNPAPARQVPDGLFRGVDYFTPNETEAEYFSGIPVKTTEDAFTAGRELLKLGVKNVIITLGKDGAALVNSKNEIIIPTTDLLPVDTTGAGDAFNGGLTVALSEGMDIITAIRFANCVASISVTRKGVSPSMPTRREADTLFDEYYGKNS